jgi:hypothetical protein
VEVPPTHTPEPGEPTVEPGQQDRPTATPMPGDETPTPEPGGGLCSGALLVGVVALAAAGLWQRMRG